MPKQVSRAGAKKVKHLTKTEQQIIDRVNYTPICGKFKWNTKTKKYDIVNPEWVNRCRARVQKLMRENNAKTPGQLLNQWDRQLRIEGKSALEAFQASPEFKEMKKLPPFVRADVIPEFFQGKRLSTSYINQYRNKQGKVPDYISSVIQSASFDAADWGRLRKTYEGENRFYCKGIRTTSNGKSGWDKVVWHYADYYVAVNNEVTKAFYKLSDGETDTFSITRNGTFKFKSRVYRKPALFNGTSVKPHHIRRNAEKVIRGNIRFEWDRKENTGMYVDNLTGEQYHFKPSTNGRACESSFYSAMFANALTAFRKRRRQKARQEHFNKVKSFMLNHKEQIFVGLFDSTRSGNCETGTLSFIKGTLNIDPEKIGAVTVGSILEKREDSFTLRACAEATERYIRKHNIQLS